MLYLLGLCNSFVTNTLRFHDILGFRISRQSPCWQHHRDRGALSQGAVNVQFSTVAVHDMFDDRQAKTRAAKFTTAVIISPVEPFGHARQVKRVHASAIINDLDSHAWGAQNRLPRYSRHPEAYAPTGGAIFKSVSNNIGEYLRQLIGIAIYFDRMLWALKLKFHPSLMGQGLQAV